ncbi:permease [Roseibium polysiphoniae]|uniref:Permease n=1 Tax=Roseibium polysiphoniae TaxID=2571221 RepID=A0A944CD91_9HYPH|nr:permease [Roseibium polysiphoniae]MBS8260449.1 permease [Roseibium polysiphoniae]
MTDTEFSPTNSGCCAPKETSCCSGKKSGFDWRPWVLTPWSIVVVVPLLVLALDPERTVEVVSFAVRAFAGTLPYIAFAVLLIAWLKAAGAEGHISRAFEGREWQAIVMAALFGGLAPFCSCEVIPFIAGLLAVGAPLSAIMAFWLSSPLIDPPTLLITAGALGWSFAIGKAVIAVSLGLFGGVAVALAMRGGMFASPVRIGSAASGSCCGASKTTGKPVWRVWKDSERTTQFWSELKANALFLAKWLALAYVLEALLVTYVPASLIAGVVGGEGLVPIVIAAFVGMPAYLNSYVAPPLLSGLIDQGMSNGAAMSFMIAGAVSSIPAMAAVWSLVRPQVFATYLGLGLFGAIASGLIFQMIV